MCVAEAERRVPAVPLSSVQRRDRERIKSELFGVSGNLQARGKRPSKVLGPRPAGRESDTSVKPRGRTCIAVPLQPTPSEQLKRPRRQRATSPPSRASASEDTGGAPSARAAPHNGPVQGQEARGGALGLIPPAESKPGLGPPLRKHARRISRALTSAAVEGTSYQSSPTENDTETEHTPRRTAAGR